MRNSTACEVLKYRVTGPEWEDATDEELQHYKEEQLAIHRRCQCSVVKRSSWWDRLGSRMVIDLYNSCNRGVGTVLARLPGTHYCLRRRDVLLMEGVLVACGVRCAYEWWRSW